MPDDHPNDTMAPRSLVDEVVTVDLVGPAKIAVGYTMTSEYGTKGMKTLQQERKDMLDDTRREHQSRSCHIVL